MRNARLSSVRAWIWPVRDTGSPSEPALAVTVRTGRISAAGCGLSQAPRRTKPRQATTAADLISYLVLAGGCRDRCTGCWRCPSDRSKWHLLLSSLLVSARSHERCSGIDNVDTDNFY